MKDKTPRVRQLALRPYQAVSVDAAPGTSVRCLEGTIWLTQDALPSDHILIPGTRFVSETDGKIVLSSMDGASVARVYTPGCNDRAAAGHGLQVDPGVIARVEREARRARNKEIGRLLRKLGDLAASAWHALKGKTEVERRKSEGRANVSRQSSAIAAR
jgi:hypothetical protein